MPLMWRAGPYPVGVYDRRGGGRSERKNVHAADEVLAALSQLDGDTEHLRRVIRKSPPDLGRVQGEYYCLLYLRTGRHSPKLRPGLHAAPHYAGYTGVVSGQVFCRQSRDGAGPHGGDVATVHHGKGLARPAVHQHDRGKGCGKVVGRRIVLVHCDRLHSQRSHTPELGGHEGVPAVDRRVGDRRPLGHHRRTGCKLIESLLQYSDHLFHV